MHLENQLKQLKQGKNSLKKQLETLQIKKEEILVELGKQFDMGAALQGCDQRAEKEEMVKKGKVRGGRRQESTGEIPAIQNGSEKREKVSGGERIDQTGKVKVASFLVTISGEERNEKGSTQEIYEGLSFSVQQVYSNESDYISLSNVPPTSVAAMLYNIYKLILLSLGQRFLFSDVVKLKEWATQNFSIENAQNGTDVLFQLDMKGTINASNLSPLRDFFESIVRIDLVHIIDEFLLGDYGLLRHIPTRKNARRKGHKIFSMGSLHGIQVSSIQRVPVSRPLRVQA
jgi:hypothetical protein